MTCAESEGMRAKAAARTKADVADVMRVCDFMEGVVCVFWVVG